MSNPEIRTIVLIGAGRLAIHFSMALSKKGYAIREVCNRTAENGRRLAGRLRAEYIPQPEQVMPDADLYIVAISDTAIPEVVERIKTNGLIIHTSGTVMMDVLRESSPNYGVIYPPQTFSTGKLLPFRSVPLCIEASSPTNLQILKSFAGSISEKVYEVSSDQRKILHLAAVFASNFSNYLISVSEELLTESGIDFRILEPIIRQTARNAAKGDVFARQTGPAVRGDQETIRRHLEMLSNYPELKSIYDLITNNIIQRKMKS